MKTSLPAGLFCKLLYPLYCCAEYHRYDLPRGERDGRGCLLLLYFGELSLRQKMLTKSKNTNIGTAIRMEIFRDTRGRWSVRIFAFSSLHYSLASAKQRARRVVLRAHEWRQLSNRSPPLTHIAHLPPLLSPSIPDPTRTSIYV